MIVSLIYMWIRYLAKYYKNLREFVSERHSFVRRKSHWIFIVLCKHKYTND